MPLHGNETFRIVQQAMLVLRADLGRTSRDFGAEATWRAVFSKAHSRHVVKTLLLLDFVWAKGHWKFDSLQSIDCQMQVDMS